jgi:hypothetical protein
MAYIFDRTSNRVSNNGVATKKAYYAHSMSLYNSKQELRDIRALQSMGFEVLNPNDVSYRGMYREFGMEFFYDIIRQQANVVAFRSLPDGSISAGVASEIKLAQELDKPVMELPSFHYRRSLSIAETRTYFKEVGLT